MNVLPFTIARPRKKLILAENSAKNIQKYSAYFRRGSLGDVDDFNQLRSREEAKEGEDFYYIA